VLEERRGRGRRHLAGAPPVDAERAARALAEAEAELAAAERAVGEARARLALADEARAAAAALAPRIDEQRRTAELWQALDGLIGSADGKRFRVFAQSLTLEALLGQANLHLGELQPRYRLMRVPGHDLDLQVVDRDLGDEVRGVSSLSGGESFLVSLALALALSSLAARDTPIESLFIDEGLGTLDPATLETVLGALDALQASGRQVGLISHVPGLAERIGVQVRVEPYGGGRSRVETDGRASAASDARPAERG
jgi:exonuclease SbcC